MKILYAIQGTGNGHLSRAREIIPALNKFCKTDILVSGYQSNVVLPYEINYRYRGLSFVFGKKGGVDLWNTYVEANIKNLKKEIDSIPIDQYDFVINDFEPVSAWACYQKKIPCVALSHQAAVLHKNAPQPKKQDLLGKFILKNYAPSSMQFGFHFGNYAPHIFTPVIRKDIRTAKIKDSGHYTVYLPSYEDEKLIKLLSHINSIKWHVFSKQVGKPTSYGNISLLPIDNNLYTNSLRKCKGLLCGAGFEGPAEAIYLGKKLFVIPMKTQFEQLCNAASLKEIGIPTTKKLKSNKLEKIQNWIDSDYRVEINYPDNTEQIIKQIFEGQVYDLLVKNNWDKKFDLKYPTNSNAALATQV